MLKEETEYSPVRNPSERRGFFVSRVKAFVGLVVFLALVIVLIVLAVMLAKEQGKKEHLYGVEKDDKSTEEVSSLRPVSCDVVVVGGGISGLYMAETLMRLKKEQDVCLFEKDTRFGGRNYDVRFSQAPNVSISVGSWRINTGHKTVMHLVRRFNIQMFKIPAFTVDYYEARGIYASSAQLLKERAFPSLLSSPFANMTPSEMRAFAWKNMTKEKALETPSTEDFLCRRVGSEGCAFLDALYGFKIDYNREQSTLFTYESSKATKYFLSEYQRPIGGLSEITKELEKSARHLGVKVYVREKVRTLSRKGNLFVVHTDHFRVSAKKLIIAVPAAPLREIIGDVASDIKRNALFESILARPCFKAVAIYTYPWWENETNSHNITLKPWEIYSSGTTCLSMMMPYSYRGPKGEGIIQLAYSLYGCPVKWGELSKLPKAVFHSELKKAVQAVFPGMVVPEPLDIVFKYWENTCWHQTRAGSNASRYDLEEWAKRPFPGEEVYMVGEAYSVIDAWNEGALLTAYKALKEGWGILKPEP